MNQVVRSYTIVLVEQPDCLVSLTCGLTAISNAVQKTLFHLKYMYGKVSSCR